MQETDCGAGDQVPHADDDAVQPSQQSHDHPCLMTGGKRRLISRRWLGTAREFTNGTPDQQKSDEDPDKILDQPEVGFHASLIAEFTSYSGVHIPLPVARCRVPQVSRFSRPGKPLLSNQPPLKPAFFSGTGGPFKPAFGLSGVVPMLGAPGSRPAGRVAHSSPFLA